MSGREVESSKNKVVLHVEGSLAVLRLGSADERIAVLTAERMDSLEESLTRVGTNPEIKVLVITGATAQGFCAGADISVINDVLDAGVGEKLAKRGQALFAQLEALPCKTVALIRGACVGGGCELALACNYRVMVDLDDSRIGLPEIRLGIIPGFGGTQRLPRLLGLPKALDLILKGQLINPQQAKNCGLVDHVLAEDISLQMPDRLARQEAFAAELALGQLPFKRHKLGVKNYFLTHTAAGRALVRSQVETAIKEETKGHYPAPPLALSTILAGLKYGEKFGYGEEAKHLGELIVGDVCKSLVHVYRISEAAGKLGRTASQEVENLPVAVLGAGVMGAGIAAVFLAKGHKVFLVDPFTEALARGKRHVQDYLLSRRNISDSRKQTLLGNLSAQENFQGLNSAGLLIEAVVEDVEIKREILSAAAETVSEKCLIATNTSSLSIDELAQSLPHAERFIGLHFFNPAEKMPLVEIVRGKQTGAREIIQAAALASRLGKYPIVVENCPGFLVNRILVPYLSEAVTLLSEGYEAVQIDRAATDFGMPMGPLRLLDEIGLDVAAKVLAIMVAGYGERMSSADYASRLLIAGRKGKKSGQGFYIYKDEAALPAADLKDLLEIKVSAEADGPVLAERLIMAMLNEAVLALDEGIAGAPGADAARQIDLGSVMGFGFPPFRGGIIAYAEKLGSSILSERLSKLSSQFGLRFSPAPGILERAQAAGGKGLSFYQSPR